MCVRACAFKFGVAHIVAILVCLMRILMNEKEKMKSTETKTNTKHTKSSDDGRKDSFGWKDKWLSWG